MSDDNVFFKWVWRFNGVALGLLLTLGLIVLVSSPMVTGGAYRDDDRQPQLTNASGEKLLASDFEEVPHTDVLSADLVALNAGEFRVYSGSSGRTDLVRNVLVFDLQAKSLKRLLPADTGYVAWADAIGSNCRENASSFPPVAWVAAVATRDSNGDGKIDATDDFSVGIASIDGSGWQVLAENLQDVGRVFASGAGRCLSIAQAADGTRLLELDLHARKLRSNTLLPKL